MKQRSVYSAVGVLFLSCSITPRISGDSSWESELSRLRSVEAARREKRNGFQGCINKETCGEYGYYLQSYSPEGLCSKCNFKQFPERFVACPFCRKPNGKCYETTTSHSCTLCSYSLQEALKKNLLQGVDQKEYPNVYNIISSAVFSSLRGLDTTISPKFIPSLHFIKNLDTIFPYTDYRPILYQGTTKTESNQKVHVWLRDGVVVTEEDKAAILHDVRTGKEKEVRIKVSALVKSFVGPETGACVLQRIPEGACTFTE